MAVNLEQIVGYLENANFKHQYIEEKKVIVLYTGDEDSTYSHYIRAKDDGDIFEWKMHILDENKDRLNIKDHKYIGRVLSHLLYLNYATKFGTWEFDPSDGDIRLAVEIPLEDALMTEKQFNRIKDFMQRNGDSAADEILHILKTGTIPEDNSEADMIAELEAMLLKLKGSASTNDGI